MSDLVIPYTTEDVDAMGSYNHSIVQANLTFLLKRIGSYAVFTELSLDASQIELKQFTIRDEIKPDVCIYPKRGMSRPFDILKMTEMPLLVVEILSPRQGTHEILEKFAVYFALGVKSCWLVDPVTAIVTVYSALDQHKSFTTGDVTDETIGIHLPLTEIFE